MDNRATTDRTPAPNSTYPKGGVSCSKDSFVVNQKLVFQIKFCGNSPALRVAIQFWVRMLSIANQISKKISAWHLELIQEIIKCGVLIGTGIPRFIPVNAHTIACSKQKNSVWFLSFSVINFILEYTHYRKNQRSILIKIVENKKGFLDGLTFGSYKKVAIFTIPIYYRD